MVFRKINNEIDSSKDGRSKLVADLKKIFSEPHFQSFKVL